MEERANAGSHHGLAHDVFGIAYVGAAAFDMHDGQVSGYDVAAIGRRLVYICRAAVPRFVCQLTQSLPVEESGN